MSLNHAVAPTDVPAIFTMSRDSLDLADHVITFHSPNVSGTPEVVVELRDVHRNLLGRTTVLTDEEPIAVVEQLLAAVQLDRCSDFITDPLGRKKVRRTIASVCPAVNAGTTAYEQARLSAPPMAI